MGVLAKMVKWKLLRMTKLTGGTLAYRAPNTEKYYLDTCQQRVNNEGTTKNWIEVVKAIKKVASRDIDLQKSQLLLSNMDADQVVVKIGDGRILHEYSIGKKLAKVKGFVKYVCYFECNDNFYDYFTRDSGALCKSAGSGMSVLIMPHFKEGDLAHWSWTVDNVHILRGCLQMAVLSYVNAYESEHFVHGDFHPANVMLKATEQRTVTFGDIVVDTNGYRTWIMDFENSYVNITSRSWTDLCFDLKKMFTLLPTFVSGLNKAGINSIFKEIMNQEENGSINQAALYDVIGKGIAFYP